MINEDGAIDEVGTLQKEMKKAKKDLEMLKTAVALLIINLQTLENLKVKNGQESSQEIQDIGKRAAQST
jgi:seryl-tRNA synthetase